MCLKHRGFADFPITIGCSFPPAALTKNAHVLRCFAENVETGQNSKQLREISSEVRSSHPNEMSEDFQVVGHAPKLMAIWLTKFLKRASNIGKAVIKGKRVNRGGGYGLEIPCEYQFMGDAFSISWLKDKLQKEGFDAK